MVVSTLVGWMQFEGGAGTTVSRGAWVPEPPGDVHSRRSPVVLSTPPQPRNSSPAGM